MIGKKPIKKVKITESIGLIRKTRYLGYKIGITQ
jgi:hypothetical protein